MDHLARAQRILELQEAENARVSSAVFLHGTAVNFRAGSDTAGSFQLTFGS